MRDLNPPGDSAGTALLRAVSHPPRVADEVYGTLRAAILARTLLPGTRLSVPSLAEHFEVSRSPVREAVQRLVQDGLATEEPRRGAVVTTLDPGAMVALYEVREVLEGLAARLACERATDDELRQLDQTLADHRRAVAEQNAEGHMLLDMQFHALVRRAARNPELATSLERVQGRIAIAMITAGPTWYPHAIEEHESILAALHAREPQLAEQRAVEHIALFRAELERNAAAGV